MDVHVEVVSDSREHFVRELFNLDLDGARAHVDILVRSVFELNSVVFGGALFDPDAQRVHRGH